METKKRERRRRRRRKEASPELPSLPLELMTEILLRTPVRSVGRFRCVSKAFCSVLTDPKFAKNHLDLNPRTLGRRVILSLNKLFAVDIDSIGDGSEGIWDFSAVKELHYSFKEDLNLLSVTKNGTIKFTIWSDAEVEYSDWGSQKGRVVVVGSSNGLVCISSVDDIVFFYNPTTGDFKRIRDLPESFLSKLVDKEQAAFDIHGFGFDVLNDDYKVVKFVVSGNSHNSEFKANVYSLKTDSWRQVRDMRYRHVHPTSGVHLNGAIHWIVKLKEDQNKSVVAAFDLKTEEFRDIALPDEAGDCNHPFMKLEVGSLKGSLCVSYCCYEMHDEIWVMNQYGVQSSWRKIQITILYSSMKPICSTKSDKEVLLRTGRSLVLYNFESDTWGDTWRALRIRGVKLGDGFEGNTYVESLISPNSYGIES